MAEACDTATLRGILEDSRRGEAATRGPTPTVTVSSAGRVIDGGNKSGWVDPAPLARRDWASMTKEEIAARDEEWRREFEARKQAEAKAK
jgi:hypothetical protein